MAEPTNQQPSSWRRWLKWLGISLFILLALLAIFHRPIIFKTTRYFIARAAEKQKLELTYDFDGSIFTTLRIENLRGTPREPGPVELIKIDLLKLRYSLWGLVTDGLPGFLESVELVDAHIELNPQEKLPRRKRKKQEFKFPALFPNRLRIENVTVISRGDRGDFILQDFNFILDPREPGRLTIERLQIPQVRTWENIEAAAASYEERNLILKNLRLGPQVELELLNIDASELDNDVLKFALRAELFGGTARVEATVTDLNESNRTQLEAKLVSISLDEMSDYLNFRPQLAGTLENFTLDFRGALSNPSTWTGTGFGVLNNLAHGEREVGDARLSLRMSDGKARLRLEELRQGSNVASATADIILPEKLRDLPKADMQGRLSLNAPKLSELGIAPEQHPSGSATAEGTFQVKEGKLTADIDVQTRDLKTKDVDVSAGKFDVQVTRDLAAEKKEKAEEKFTVKGAAEELRFGEYTAEKVDIDVTGDGRKLDITQLDLRQGENVVSLKGEYTLPEKPADFDLTVADITIDISAPALKQFVARQTGKELEGALKVDGKLFRRNGKLQGHFIIDANDLRYAGVHAERMDANIDIVDGVAHVKELALIVSDQNHLNAAGQMQLQKPYEYSGRVDADLRNLAVFQPLLAGAEKPKQLDGSLRLVWKGHGAVKPTTHSGQGELILENGRYGELHPLSAQISGSYSPEQMDFPIVRASVDDTDFSASVHYADKRMAVTGIEIEQDGALVLYGNAKVPLDLQKLDRPGAAIPPEGEFEVAIFSKDVALKTISGIAETELPATGTVTLTLTAHGTRSDLIASLDVRGRNLQLPKQPQLKPANIDLTLVAENERMTVDGVVRQPQVQPITITGNVPVNFEAQQLERIIAPSAPIELKVQMPSSSLDFVATVVEAIRDVDGTAALTLNVSGTRNDPDLSGAAMLNIRRMRFRNHDIPPLGLLDGRISFTENRVNFERFSGEIAGGPFRLSGRIDLPELSKPVFDLRFTSGSALLVRNDTVTVRADSNLAITGPLKSGSVTGSVTITNSRFFREIEILPLSLPGRPAPRPPGGGGPPNVSFDNPILRDWKFDITINTQPRDPFLIRGNLVEGQAHVDMQFTGTGLEPTLSGNVRIDNFVTSLPFSRLTVDGGIVYFTEVRPFVPQFQIQGKTRMRDYDITAYIYGTAYQPEVLFSSEPPLPQDEIIALLATGATKRELLEGGQVVAGRATMLAFQSLYRKIFKKRPVARDKSFLDRFDFQLGAVDPKTGRESVLGEFELTDQWSMIGSFDIQGDFRGGVKYLIRFR